MMKRGVLVSFLILGAVIFSSCLPGSQTAVAPPSASTPADDVFINLFRAIEEGRPEQFTAAVSMTCNPDRERIWSSLQSFLKDAEKIEYNVSVTDRLKSGNDIIYVFNWESKLENRTTGEIESASGRAEWTLSRASGRFLLEQIAGTNVFTID